MSNNTLRGQSSPHKPHATLPGSDLRQAADLRRPHGNGHREGRAEDGSAQEAGGCRLGMVKRTDENGLCGHTKESDGVCRPLVDTMDIKE